MLIVLNFTGKNVLYHTFEEFVTELQYLDGSGGSAIVLTMAKHSIVDQDEDSWLVSDIRMR